MSKGHDWSLEICFLYLIYLSNVQIFVFLCMCVYRISYVNKTIFQQQKCRLENNCLNYVMNYLKKKMKIQKKHIQKRFYLLHVESSFPKIIFYYLEC